MARPLQKHNLGITAMTLRGQAWSDTTEAFLSVPAGAKGPNKAALAGSVRGLTRLWGEQGAPGAQKDCRTDTKAWASREEQQGCRGKQPTSGEAQLAWSQGASQVLSPHCPFHPPRGFLQPSPKGSQKPETPVQTGPSRCRGQGGTGKQVPEEGDPAHPSGSRARICLSTGGSAPAPQLAGGFLGPRV